MNREDQFLKAVVNLAQTLGWMASHHDKSARKVGERWISNHVGDKGFPDLVLIRPPRLIMAELKTGTRYTDSTTGKRGGAYGLTPDQKRWMGALNECPGVEAFTWTPGQLDEIAAVLAR